MTAKSKTLKTRSTHATASKPPRARKKVPPAAAQAFDALAGHLTAPQPPARGKRVRKGSSAKPAPRPAFVARLIDATKAIHVILPDNRPREAPALPAHTHAVLTSLGMLAKTRPAVRESTLATMFGPVAIKHHVLKGNMERAPGGKIRLTIQGFDKFTSRADSPSFDTARAQAYADVFVEGKIAPSLGLKATDVFAIGVAL